MSEEANEAVEAQEQPEPEAQPDHSPAEVQAREGGWKPQDEWGPWIGWNGGECPVGGEVVVESQLNKGSTFTIRLPVVG